MLGSNLITVSLVSYMQENKGVQKWTSFFVNMYYKLRYNCHIVSILSCFCHIVAVSLCNEINDMKKLNKKCNLYTITCYSALHQPFEKVIYNWAFSLEENWQDEKIILDFWRLDGYRFRKVELSKN